MTSKKDHMEEVGMEAADIKKLRAQFIPMLIFPVAVGAIFYFIFNFVLKGFGDSFEEGGFMVYAFGLFGLFFVGIIAYMIWSFAADLKGGIKQRITGEVTYKNLHIQKSHNHGTGARRNSSSKTTRHYSIFIDGVKYKVDVKAYNAVTVGDTIRMDRAPRSGLTLDIQILEQAETPETIEQKAVDLSYLQTKIEPVQLSEADYGILKRAMFLYMRQRFAWMIVPLLIIISLVSSGLSGLLIFLFPIVIIVAVQFYKIMRSLVNFLRNQKSGQKHGETAIVTDKATVTSNRTSDKFQINTSIGSLSVSKKIYDQLRNDDKVIIWRPTYGTDKLSIVTMDQKEYYLF